MTNQEQKLIKEFRKIIIQSVEETEREHRSPSVYIDMVGEIAIEKLEILIKLLKNKWEKK